jgi:dsRNA-specific ribonuclease
MFRLQQNLKNSNNFITLQQQNPILARTVYSSLNLRFLPSAFYSTKKINLPKINDEKVVTTLFTKYDRLDSFIGDRAYNYYATRALKLKVPGAIRRDFMIIANRIIRREFLAEIAVKCELDKLMLQHTKNNYHLGEMMEAYCSAMIFNGMEEEMKKFTSDIVDYYFEEKKEKKKKKKKANKVVKEGQNKTIEEMKKNDDKKEEKKDKQKGMVEMKKNDDKKDDKKDDKTTNEITNKVVKEINNEEKQQKGVEINKNDKHKNIKENKVSSENSKKKKKKKKGTNDKTIKEKEKEIILSIKGQ